MSGSGRGEATGKNRSAPQDAAFELLIEDMENSLKVRSLFSYNNFLIEYGISICYPNDEKAIYLIHFN